MVATEKWRYPKPVKIKRPAWVVARQGGGQSSIDRAFSMLMASSRTIS
ncbi:hypothetical protein MF672_050980 (plasmid) [Actinomadura sp. ATCC 31491]|uniref:DUF397 domain-containing protein n=1 Tax=Actinomadura luzonensis TaxID=2805427 RepID=A0ABT0GCD5_9ACTN|nr:hypothetical protein [Actinomadura luzonensis]MCK2222078.1 hypothetical protein [Actinomadura luzonensis]